MGVRPKSSLGIPRPTHPLKTLETFKLFKIEAFALAFASCPLAPGHGWASQAGRPARPGGSWPASQQQGRQQPARPAGRGRASQAGQASRLSQHRPAQGQAGPSRAKPATGEPTHTRARPGSRARPGQQGSRAWVRKPSPRSQDPAAVAQVCDFAQAQGPEAVAN